MNDAALAALFVVGLLVSLLTSHRLVRDIDDLGTWLGLTEAVVGLLAAIGADAPEITSATTALVRHQHDVGAGIAVGSNVFNLAALVGLGALVAGRIALHRRVVLLSGGVATVVAALSLAVLTGGLAPLLGLLLVAVVLGPYVALCSRRPNELQRLPVPARAATWLAQAIGEEDEEYRLALATPTTRPRSLGMVLGLAILVASSVALEDLATTLGSRLHMSGIVVGGLVLAALTSIPNAVAAIYLARQGRGVAVLSTAFNSNAINVAIALLLPAAVFGLHVSGPGTFVGGAYLALTLATVLLALPRHALGRSAGVVIVTLYGCFVLTVVLIGTG